MSAVIRAGGLLRCWCCLSDGLRHRHRSCLIDIVIRVRHPQHNTVTDCTRNPTPHGAVTIYVAIYSCMHSQHASGASINLSSYCTISYHSIFQGEKHLNGCSCPLMRRLALRISASTRRAVSFARALLIHAGLPHGHATRQPRWKLSGHCNAATEGTADVPRGWRAGCWLT